MTLSLGKQKWILGSIIVLLLSVIGSSVYYLLGGFDEVVVYEVPGEDRNIVGKYFRGYYAHPDLEQIWLESREAINDGSLSGDLAVVNYQNDSLDNDEVEQFIGVALSGGMAEIPSDFEVLQLKIDKKLALFLSMHPLVRPNPFTVEDLFNNYASEKSLELGKYTLELHFEDNSMTVEVPIQ